MRVPVNSFEFQCCHHTPLCEGGQLVRRGKDEQCKVHVFCVWEVENNDKQIPPLLLFVLIENAFKYVSRSVSKPNYIRICFTQKGDYVLLDVENSKLDMHDKNKTSGLGLENMKRRLDILYHRNYHLSVRETDTVYHSRLELWQK